MCDLPTGSPFYWGWEKQNLQSQWNTKTLYILYLNWPLDINIILCSEENIAAQWNLRCFLLFALVAKCVWKNFFLLKFHHLKLNTNISIFLPIFGSSLQFEQKKLQNFHLSFSQKSNEWISDENSVSFLCSQEEGAIKSHNCILIYKSGTEGDEHNTPDSHFIGLTTKMLKVKRLEEITTCYNSNRLEKTAFFQCMEKVEKMKCFLEESSSEQDSRSGNNEVIVC